MAEFIVGKTANEVWKKAAAKLLKQNNTLNGRTGEVYELLHTFIEIKEPRQKWVFDRIPPISVGYALAELVWIINGEDRSDVINAWNPSLKTFSGKGKFYHGAYGKRIRYHFGFDQMEKAYQALQNVPESRQIVIQIYDTKVDFPVESGRPRDADIPCNVCSMLKVRDEKLEWCQIMRSNDVLLGMPYNFVQFTGIQEILAGWLRLDVGSYNHYSDSLHLYNRDISKIGIGQEMKIRNNDSLSLSKEESERVFKDIYERMKALVFNEVTEKEIYSLAQLNSEHEAYNNIMLIIAAYIAHKVHYSDLTKELVEKCKNSVYTTMWNRWVNE
ncbi:thymidylate synthase [Sedimentibacter saalensis]|uniref:Thymidylate synthase n=1 Tax=Sedimentibacter saalensis TaxID=130788 RepID=A0A562JL69_9FIRM|nr:thymidylate synthase [Sedimentibacter saalensis]TWH83454.1 thymidylate synthase [Sedimentibacter saalensis]